MQEISEVSDVPFRGYTSAARTIRAPHHTIFTAKHQEKINMPKFEVEVAVSYKKTLTVYAASEGEAEEKACDFCRKWSNIHDAEALNVEEIE